MKNIKKKRINLIVSESIYQTLQSMTLESGVSMNGIINMILIEKSQAFRETEYFKKMNEEMKWQKENQG